MYNTAKEALESLPRTVRVRLWYGDAKTGLAWNEEYNVLGYVGRSTGIKPCMLLVNNTRSMGGGAILVDSVIKVVRTDSGSVLYAHPKFHTSKYTLAPSDHPDYKAAVNYGGYKNAARFKTPQAAENWIAFMEGRRFSK